MKMWNHDCSFCVYLFSMKIDNLLQTRRKIFRNYDVYFCIEDRYFIFRYGSNEEYNVYSLEWIENRLLHNSIRDISKKVIYKRAIRRAKKLKLIE